MSCHLPETCTSLLAFLLVVINLRLELVDVELLSVLALVLESELDVGT